MRVTLPVVVIVAVVAGVALSSTRASAATAANNLMAKINSCSNVQHAAGDARSSNGGD